MSNKEYLSECCGSPVVTSGEPDFPEDDKVVTWHYVCTKCHQPCNVLEKYEEGEDTWEIVFEPDFEIKPPKDED